MFIGIISLWLQEHETMIPIGTYVMVEWELLIVLSLEEYRQKTNKMATIKINR